VCQWQDNLIDFVFDIDIAPVRQRDGHICEPCEPVRRAVFPSLDALWAPYGRAVAWLHETLMLAR
jgi:hypothetical protein